MTPEALLRQVDAALAAGQDQAARGALAELWRTAPGPATARLVLSRLERMSLKPVACRLAIARSFTVEPAVPMLRAAAGVHGVDLQVQVGGFNSYAQEMLDAGSSLYGFAPQMAILAVQTRDIAPELWAGFADLRPAEVETVVQRVAGEFREWVTAFRSRSQAHLILHTLEMPELPRNGVLDAQRENGQMEAIHRLNAELGGIARTISGVYLLDYDALVARHGRGRWHDESKWLAMRLPVAADALPALADEWVRYVLPLTGRTAKVLVTDLDHTLWGGVIGEDGIEGIQLGTEYPGAAYQALQRAMLDLYRRGIVLAVCSKNNPSDAMEAIERHPGMLLRAEHFAALRINWRDKAQNLREIAAELNVGIDSLAFLDDNPAERQWIREQLPEVTVIELSEEPLEWSGMLRASPVFERLALSEEDRERGRYYAGQRMREELRQTAGSLESYYHSLRMTVEIGPVTGASLARVAQLTQKTNQFNLTTHRYTEQQLQEMMADAAWRLYALRAGDRFGDNGLVGTALVRIGGDVWEIDTLLLSCRVIGRTIETALLATIAEDASNHGAGSLTGWYIPTPKNAPARNFYQAHQFVLTAEQDGAERWELDLAAQEIGVPPWIVRTNTSTTGRTA